LLTDTQTTVITYLPWWR